MTEPGPQLYLITPAAPDLATLPDLLAAILDAPPMPVGCVRLTTSGMDEDRIRATADALRAICHDRDTALLIQDHFRLAGPLGLDGAHLSYAREYRDARKALGPDMIVGCFCGTSRHAAMTAAEAGADYVALGPFADPGALGTGERADPDLVRWWAETIETPLVVEGLDAEALTALAPLADFLALDPPLWTTPEALAALLGETAR
jgi:thiamine-phosphate pyrophosphorylase